MLPVAEERHSYRQQIQLGNTCQVRMSAWQARNGCIGIVAVYGLVVPACLRSLHARLAEIEQSAQAVASVLILSQAVVAASADELVHSEIAQLDMGGGVRLAPRALVVARVNLPGFRRYAWAMANAGVGRYVFNDSQTAPALRWARAMGAQVQAEAQWRSRPATRRQSPSGG